MNQSSNKRRLGEDGEGMACRYLLRKGYSIEARNWRKGRREIDIIARDGEVLIFIEVKTRINRYPRERDLHVKPAQWKAITQAASAYMHQCGHEWEVRFDVIAVDYLQNGTILVRHIPDAYFPF